MIRLRAARLLEAALYGPDLDSLERFYCDRFGLELVAKTPGRNAVLRCGPSALILFDPAESGQPGGLFPPHGTHGPGHIAFCVPLEEMPAWRAELAEAGIAIESEMEWPDGTRSIYFRDPAGNSIELAPPTLWNGLGRTAAPPVGASSEPDPAGALQADRSFFRLLAAADAAGLEALLTDDFKLIDVFRGGEIPRAALLELIDSGALSFEPIEPAEVTVRRYGGTAIVTGRTEMRGSFGETPFGAPSRYTHIYLHDGERWRMAAAQGTIITPEPGQP